jgi:hypothetical protein
LAKYLSGKINNGSVSWTGTEFIVGKVGGLSETETAKQFSADEMKEETGIELGNVSSNEEDITEDEKLQKQLTKGVNKRKRSDSTSSSTSSISSFVQEERVKSSSLAKSGSFQNEVSLLKHKGKSKLKRNDLKKKAVAKKAKVRKILAELKKKKAKKLKRRRLGKTARESRVKQVVSEPEESSEQSAGDSSTDGEYEARIQNQERRMERWERAKKEEAVLKGIEHKGLRVQYEFNGEMLERLVDLRGHLRSMKGEAGKIIDTMQAGFEHRQKLLRVADQHGWEVVSVYEGGQDLASGTTLEERESDARKLSNAVKEVERRRKPISRPMGQIGGAAPERPVWGQRNWSNKGATGSESTCNRCGEKGHWVKQCPKRPVIQKKRKAGSQ